MQATDWSAVAKVDTALILMGTRKLKEISQALIAGGKPCNCAVAVVQWAYTSNQRVLYGTLENIVSIAGDLTKLSPSIIIVGKVAGFGLLSGSVGPTSTEL